MCKLSKIMRYEVSLRENQGSNFKYAVQKLEHYPYIQQDLYLKTKLDFILIQVLLISRVKVSKM